MQSAFAVVIVIGAISMLAKLAGEISIFMDTASLVFLLLFMYACTVIAYGSTGMIKSIIGLKYLFASDIADTPSSQFLALIFKKQIVFIYGGAFIALLLGSIAIHANVSESLVFHRAYAVNLLILLYAAIFSEGVLRPLVAKLESR